MNNFKDEVMKACMEHMIILLPILLSLTVGLAFLIAILSGIMWVFPDQPKVCPECQHVLTEKK